MSDSIRLPHHADSPARTIKMTYTNYRGETSVRAVVPLAIVFGTSEYHSGAQWFMVAFDKSRQANRNFALADCDFTKTDGN